MRQEDLAIPKGQVDPIDVEVNVLQLDVGDVLFFENRIFNIAAPNLSDRVSKVLIYGNAYRWMKQDVYLDNRDVARLTKADPTTGQLLGGYRDIDIPPWALQDCADRHAARRRTVSWTVTV